jgi:hypothetical protein
MKTFLLAAALLLFGGFFPPPPVVAEDGALLFEKLTSHTCHGAQGKGMIRTEDKVRFWLRKKEMYRKMVKEGVPVDIVKQLRPLYKKKFTDVGKFVKAIEENIGETHTGKYKEIIINIAGRIYWRKGDLIRGFEDYPRHAGNKKIYLFRQMKDILESKRINGNSEAMRGIKPFIDNNNITDDDFRSIAEYLSNVK